MRRRGPGPAAPGLDGAGRRQAVGARRRAESTFGRPRVGGLSTPPRAGARSPGGPAGLGEGTLMEPSSRETINVEINGEPYEREVEARRLLIHFVRDDAGLTGSHIGCDTGNCRACSVLLNGTLVKSCMLLAVQADGAKVETVEGLAQDGQLTALQQSFSDHHALQCGYCTPGMLMSATALLRANGNPSEEQVGSASQGNTCRCT